jgi:hypothetical protein
LYFFKWLPERNDLRTPILINSDSYIQDILEKLTQDNTRGKTKTTPVNKLQQHIIHRAIKWKRMLENREIESLSEISRQEGLTRARVTQIMNLLKLLSGWQKFLAALDDLEEMRKYSERKLRSYCSNGFTNKPPPIRKKPLSEAESKVTGKTRSKRKQPPEIIVAEIDEPLSHLDIEMLKRLIRKAALRKLKKLENGRG